jgi:uncharacterized protein
VHATRLRTEDEDMVQGLLAVDAPLNLFLLGMLSERGIRASSAEVWIGAVDGARAELVGVALAIGVDARRGADLVVPWGTVAAGEVLGQALAPFHGARSIVGPRDVSDALWRAMGDHPCRIRYDQRLFVCAQPSAGPSLKVRPARLDELALMVDWSVRMNEEDLGEQPWTTNRDSFAEGVERRVRNGHILVASDGNQPVFKVDVGTRLPAGVQVGGTYVPPSQRGRGIATAAMRAVCAELLRHHEKVVLHANEGNIGAVKAYGTAGFQVSAPMRLSIAS